MSGRIISQLRAANGLDALTLERLFERAPYTYKVYQIRKRTGGFRTIAQPARETKLIQNWLLDNVFSSLPVHSSATAYRSGSSIRNNAAVHKDASYLVKLDFKNFFQSIKYNDLIQLFSAHLSETYTATDIAKIATISSFHPGNQDGLCLSVGAPTSPSLANAMMFEFDVEVSEWCQKNGINYTRYADDLAFSTNNQGLSTKIETLVKELLLKLAYPRLTLNQDKTTFLSMKHRRRVTGLILNNEGNVSLGRARKREISSLIHSFRLNLLSESEISRMQGLLGFARDVEPLFVCSMNRKYGNDVLEKIFKHRKNNDVVLE